MTGWVARDAVHQVGSTDAFCGLRLFFRAGWYALTDFVAVHLLEALQLRVGQLAFEPVPGFDLVRLFIEKLRGILKADGIRHGTSRKGTFGSCATQSRQGSEDQGGLASAADPIL